MEKMGVDKQEQERLLNLLEEELKNSLKEKEF